jgi:hypothetical protein
MNEEKANKYFIHGAQNGDLKCRNHLVETKAIFSLRQVEQRQESIDFNPYTSENKSPEKSTMKKRMDLANSIRANESPIKWGVGKSKLESNLQKDFEKYEIEITEAEERESDLYNVENRIEEEEKDEEEEDEFDIPSAPSHSVKKKQTPSPFPHKRKALVH